MITRRSVLVGGAGMLALGVDGGGAAFGAESGKKFEIVMCAKQEGISWFDDMRKGVEQFAARLWRQCLPDRAGDRRSGQAGPDGRKPDRQARRRHSGECPTIPSPINADPGKGAQGRQSSSSATKPRAWPASPTTTWKLSRTKTSAPLCSRTSPRPWEVEGKYAGIVGALTMETQHCSGFKAWSRTRPEELPQARVRAVRAALKTTTTRRPLSTRSTKRSRSTRT